MPFLALLLSWGCGGEEGGAHAAGEARDPAARATAPALPAAGASEAAGVAPELDGVVPEDPEALPDDGVDPPAVSGAAPGSAPSASPESPGADPPPGRPGAFASPDTAWFAGGCFWCMEPPYDALGGVISTRSGFMGGWMERPSYQDVTSGGTGHAEVVQVVFDPARVSYERLLEVFWRNVDPLDPGGQFCDRGEIYRSEIFVRDEDQARAARASRRALEESGRFTDPIVTRISWATPFWEAEEYHQGYYRKNPVRYRFYRTACGRDRRLAELWGNG